jgi:hypothetical protein
MQFNLATLQSGDPCDLQPKSSNMSKCIVQYVQNNISCQISFLGTPSDLPVCDNAKQLEKMMDLTNIIQYADEAEILKMTGRATSYYESGFVIEITHHVPGAMEFLLTTNHSTRQCKPGIFQITYY